MNAKWLGLAMLMAFSFPTVVVAKHDKFELVGKDIPTAVSGYAGGAWELGVDGSFQGLRSIFWGEKSDDPCGLYIATQHINTGQSILAEKDLPDPDRVSKYVYGEFKIVTDSKQPYFDNSSGAPVLRHVEELKLDCHRNHRTVSALAYDSYVYKISVCTTDKKESYKNKLKGIRLWARQIVSRDYKDNEDPILIDQPTAQEAYHAPHCKKWHTPVQCSPGEIATRLVVQHNSLDHRDWATGLALYCKKVRVKKHDGDTSIEQTPTGTPTSQNPRLP